MLKYLLSFLFTVTAAAQIPCGPGWIPVGSNGSVYAFTQWNGRLVAAGSFTQIGGVNANRIAAFDGQTWAPLGNGFDSTVRALAVLDGQLIAGGDFQSSGPASVPFLGRYSGTAWSAFTGTPPNGPVHALLAGNPEPQRGGGAGTLYIGGTFLTPSAYVRRYFLNEIGDGFAGVSSGVNGPVYGIAGSPFEIVIFVGDFTLADGFPVKNMAVYLGGEFLEGGYAVLNGAARCFLLDGQLALIGGDFTLTDAAAALRIAQLPNGIAAPLGVGFNASVLALQKYNGAYFAGGAFTQTGATPLVGLGQLLNTAWQPVGSGVTGTVRALFEFQGELWVGGDFLNAGGVSSRGIARWNSTGAPWFRSNPAPQTVNSFASAQFSISPAVGYQSVGLTYQWLYNGNPVTPGLQPSGATISDGTSNTLVISEATVAEAGNYSVVVSGPCGVLYTSPTAALSVNLPDACTPDWVAAFPAAPTFDGAVRSVLAWDDDDNTGTPPQTIVAGAFKKLGKTIVLSRIARWTGTAFEQIGDGLNNTVNVVKSFDADGPGGNPPWVIAGGSFTKTGSAALSRIGRWDGATWAGIGAGFNSTVNTLTTFDFDGPGGQLPQLVAGGSFTKSGASSGINRISRFDGVSWRPIGQGFNGNVNGLLVGDPDGAGPIGTVLIAGGSFTKSGATKINRLAYWDSVQWQPIGTGFNGTVNALAIYESALYCGGSFTKSASTKINRLARWFDEQFEQVGDGASNTVNALEVADLDGLGPGAARLYAAGAFTKTGATLLSRIGVWDGEAWLPLGAGASGTVLCLGQVAIPAGADGTAALLIGGDFKTVDGLAQRALAAYRCPAPQLLGQASRPASLADICGTGGSDTGPDGQVTVDDLIAFVVAATSDDPIADLVAADGADSGPDWKVTVDDVLAFIEAYATSP